VNEIIKKGILKKASDIHIKFDDLDGMEIKYRIDGILQEVEELFDVIDKKILEKVYDYNGISDDIALISGFDTSSLTGAAAIGKEVGVGLGKGAVGLGKLAKDGVVAIGKAGAKGASKIANQIEASALTKITENLPKNAMYNKTNGIISIENKNFIQVGTDTLTNSPILREIGYNKGSYALKGNHYVSTADGLYMIGKNALQKTGTKVITNSNLAEFMKPGVNPIKDIKFYDSSKTSGIVTGGIISAGIDTYSQYTKNNNSFNNYDPLSAVINTSIGLYTGGASYMLSAITRGAAGNAASEIYSQATDLSKDMDGKRILLKTGIGGFAGFVTSGAGKIGEKIPRGRDGNYKTILENTAGAAMGLMQAEVDNRQ